MASRSTQTDSAIGWISTSDCLLLGFALMLLFALHAAASKMALARGLQKERATAEDLRDVVRRTLETSEKDRTAAEELRSRYSAEVQLLTDEVSGLREMCDALSKSESGATGDLTKAWAEQERLRTLNKGLNATIVAVRHEAADLRRNRDDLMGSMAKAREELEELRRERDGMRASISGQVAEIESLRGELRDANRSAKNHRAELLGRGRDISRLKELVTSTDSAEKVQLAAQNVLGFKGQFDNVVFVIDTSHSMTHVSDPAKPGYRHARYDPARWNKTKREIISWARNLPRKSLRLVFFNSVVEEHPGNGSAYSMDAASREESVEKITALLESVVPDGQTDTLSALRKAYSYAGVDTMILFTDGNPMMQTARGEDQSKTLSDGVRREIRLHKNIPVNVVGIGEYFEKAFADFLRDISSTTGGEFIGR